MGFIFMGVIICKYVLVCSLRLLINELLNDFLDLWIFFLIFIIKVNGKMFWMVNKVFNCFFFIYESICICFLWNVRCYEFNGWVVVSKLYVYNGFFFVNCFVKFRLWI